MERDDMSKNKNSCQNANLMYVEKSLYLVLYSTCLSSDDKCPLAVEQMCSAVWLGRFLIPNVKSLLFI